MNEKTNRKKIFLIIVLFIICIAIFLNILLDTYIPILDIHQFGIRKYLKDQEYNDEFTDIVFIEKNDYVKGHGCDGATFYIDEGKYYRYKVHAKKANVDFYVQYRTNLSYKDGVLTDSCGIKDSVPGYEDNYITEIAKNDVLLEFRDILGNEVDIQFITFSDDEERGVLNTSGIYYLEIYFNKTLEELYSEDFLNKLKQISDPELAFYNYDDIIRFRDVTIYFSNCELEIFKNNNEMCISFENNKEDTESLKQHQKKIEDWLYNNHDEYKLFINRTRKEEIQ